MAKQLIFTSAPAGLRPGTRGFCTVAASKDMPPPLVSKLETLSGYTHAFNPSGPDAARNPIVWSYVRLRVGKNSYRVLSRCSAAGADYTGRSNTIAHHLVIDPDEQVSGSAAAVLKARATFVESWDGPPKHLDPVAVDAPAEPPTPCKAWEHAFGDAGYAGLVLHCCQQSPRLPAYVVYPEGADALAMIAQAVSIAPESMSGWGNTFSTHYAGNMHDAECMLRFIMADTPAAMEIPKTGTAIVIRPEQLPPLPNDEWTAAARDGRRVQLSTQQPPPLARTGPPAARKGQRPQSGKPLPQKVAAATSAAYELSEPEPQSQHQAPPAAPQIEFAPERRTNPLLIWGGLVAALVFAAVIGFLLTKSLGGQSADESNDQLAAKILPREQPDVTPGDEDKDGADPSPPADSEQPEPNNGTSQERPSDPPDAPPESNDGTSPETGQNRPLGNQSNHAPIDSPSTEDGGQDTNPATPVDPDHGDSGQQVTPPDPVWTAFTNAEAMNFNRSVPEFPDDKQRAIGLKHETPIELARPDDTLKLILQCPGGDLELVKGEGDGRFTVEHKGHAITSLRFDENEGASLLRVTLDKGDPAKLSRLTGSSLVLRSGKQTTKILYFQDAVIDKGTINVPLPPEDSPNKKITNISFSQPLKIPQITIEKNKSAFAHDDSMLNWAIKLQETNELLAIRLDPKQANENEDAPKEYILIAQSRPLYRDLKVFAESNKKLDKTKHILKIYEEYKKLFTDLKADLKAKNETKDKLGDTAHQEAIRLDNRMDQLGVRQADYEFLDRKKKYRMESHVDEAIDKIQEKIKEDARPAVERAKKILRQQKDTYDQKRKSFAEQYGTDFEIELLSEMRVPAATLTVKLDFRDLDIKD